ncbi:hypothetical protein ABFX02_07G063200 [Erythranthe guttata]
MEKINISLFLICLLVGVAHSKPTIGRKQAVDWCIAIANTPADKLQGFIDYACGVIDCSAILPGGPCYAPNNLLAHTDYALNQFYKSRGTCNADIGAIITIDPSYGNCKFS